ncbi:hemicentin-2-like [Lampris incognitus]|uniref:hemicentin-2-like n=1 Tax=Lampris incognitus TaxID=2546036 RepID=UPI0024B526CB|nr:hemicentin-2-like [Lampris incognitus]
MPMASVTPVLSLEHPDQHVYTTESVSLLCQGRNSSSDWTYLWFDNNQGTPRQSADPSLPSYNIRSASLTDSGTYWCQIQRGEEVSGLSNSISLDVIEPPRPLLQPLSQPLDVFPSETLELSCAVQGSSAWIFNWYRNGQQISENSHMSLNGEGSTLTISPAPQASGEYSGSYSCRAQHKNRSVVSGDSNSVRLQVYESKPKPLMTQSPSVEEVYVGEPVNFGCGVDVSSGWEFLWYRNGALLPASGNKFNITSVTPADSGTYHCMARRGKIIFDTENSETRTLRVSERPVPSLALRSPWQDVFVSEEVKLSCGVQNSSAEWTYEWFKDSQAVQMDDSVAQSSDGASLAISSASDEHRGTYSCRGRHRSRPVSTKTSDGLLLKVYGIPVPSLRRDTSWPDVFPSETVALTCGMQNSSDWIYTWHRDGRRLEVHPDLSFGPDTSSLSLTPAKPEFSGTYACDGEHKHRRVKTKSSNQLHVTVHESKPKPLMTQSPSVEEVYVGEPVNFGCGVDVSSGWEFLWYRNGALLPASGNKFNITSVTPANSGTYHCMARRGKIIFNTENSETRTLRVSERPVPSLALRSPWQDVFPSEEVKLSCGVQSSNAEWIYKWFKDSQAVQMDDSVSQSSDGASLAISSASDEHRGTYSCRGRHRSRPVSTKTSDGLLLEVYDQIPRALLTQEPGYEDMYAEETVSFSCNVNVSGGWEYLWYKEETRLTTARSRHTIMSVVPANTGAYRCKAKRGQTNALQSDLSKSSNIRVRVRPMAVVVLLNGWSEAFSTDTLVLRCVVQESQYTWNYTWFREKEEIPLFHSDQHLVTPQDDPQQSQYTCKGVRTGRPSYSTLSEPFKTKNLLLKRRLLLSISGVLFFGIIFVAVGCIVLRATRKQAEESTNLEEPDLFLTMAELKARDDAPCPLAEYITEEQLIRSAEDGEDNGAVCSETTPLPISSPEDQEGTSESLGHADNGGLTSFK